MPIRSTPIHGLTNRVMFVPQLLFAPKQPKLNCDKGFESPQLLPSSHSVKVGGGVVCIHLELVCLSLTSVIYFVFFPPFRDKINHKYGVFSQSPWVICSSLIYLSDGRLLSFTDRWNLRMGHAGSCVSHLCFVYACKQIRHLRMFMCLQEHECRETDVL